MAGIVELSESDQKPTLLSLKRGGLAVLAVLELLIVSARFDSRVLVEGQGLFRFFAEHLPLIPQFIAVACAATLVFGGKELTVCVAEVKGHARRHCVPLLFVSHLAIFALFIAVSDFYFEVDRGAYPIIFACWSLLALGTAASWLAVMIDPIIWFSVGSKVFIPFLVGACVGALAWFSGQWAVEAWSLLAFATFQLVWLILTVFCVGAFQDAAVLTIGTSKFAVTIAPECSGCEGMGLAIVFIATYLWWKRKEHRFPRSFVLIPASVCLMFIANAIRISALILIGHFGAPEIASGGFHSQAGWIGFNLVTLGIVAFARTSPFFCATEVQKNVLSAEGPVEYHSLPMLAPFICLTLSIMLLGAVRSGFDWLYPVRFFAVAVVFAVFFRRYPRDYWRLTFHWTSPAIGVGVYVIWSLLETSDNGVAKSLYESARSLSPVVFFFWLAFRFLGSVVTVPLAEEFAFRGYLLPWIAGQQSRNWSWAALVVSSVAFGMLHPGRWIAGTIAGLLYGVAYYRKGKVMEAVLAHATTNALIALEAILFSRWYLWG